MSEALKTAEELRADAMNALGEPSPPDPSKDNNGEPPAPPTDPEDKPAPPKDDPESDPNPEPDPDNEPENKGKDWQVPGERLQSEVKKRKEAEAKVAAAEEREKELKAKLEVADKPKVPADDPEEEDDDVVLTPQVKKALEKDGYVKAEKIDEIVESKLSARAASEAEQVQAKQDVTDLRGWAKKQGYPDFKIEEILPIAKEQFGNSINKTALRAVYREKYEDEIQDVLIKQANASKSASAERPGGAPAVNPETPKAGKDGIKSRIAAAIPD